MPLAIIGGTGVDEMGWLASGPRSTVITRFGPAELVEGKLDGTTLLFAPRHGAEHSVPPSQVNYRALIAALKKAGATRVIGVCTVGSLKHELPAGSFALLGDFIDLTKRRQDTFFDSEDGPVVHTDFLMPYCPEISAALTGACKDEGVAFEEEATYVSVEGPRYETPAEIRLYASWGGHVVGMTNVPEVVLAREAGLCYGAIAIVSNLASGLSPTPLTHEEVRAAARSAGDTLGRILRRAIAGIPAERACWCGSNTSLVL